MKNLRFSIIEKIFRHIVIPIIGITYFDWAGIFLYYWAENFVDGFNIIARNLIFSKKGGENVAKRAGSAFLFGFVYYWFTMIHGVFVVVFTTMFIGFDYVLVNGGFDINNQIQMSLDPFTIVASSLSEYIILFFIYKSLLLLIDIVNIKFINRNADQNKYLELDIVQPLSPRVFTLHIALIFTPMILIIPLQIIFAIFSLMSIALEEQLDIEVIRRIVQITIVIVLNLILLFVGYLGNKLFRVKK